ncbi:MAG: Holliday junction resolvase RuvX [Chloroflexi bacterium]|nr:Holliday junction resolvase RuvX [Chloroflexota bacterium]
MRMMGLDVGDKRIGVSLCDPMEVLASAFGVIERTDDAADIQAIMELAKEHDVGRIIVGLPRLLEGGIGTQAHKTIDFAGELSEEIGIPVEMVDERFSSSIAEDLLRKAGKSHREIKEKIDAAAAALILQWYIDEHTVITNTSMENEVQ